MVQASSSFLKRVSRNFYRLSSAQFLRPFKPPTMSLTLSVISARRAVRSSMCSRCLRQSIASARMSSTTAEASSPLLGKIKNDMKTAMRAKDTVR